MEPSEEFVFDVDPELIEICKDIKKIGLSTEDWEDHQSDDGIQTDTYTGGYFGAEVQFSFDFFDEDGVQYWFELRLDDIDAILAGEIETLVATRG